MTLQDLAQGNGFALIDPHGDLVERIASQIPTFRQADTIYLNAADPTQPYGYNPLRHVREDRIALAASGLMEVFKKMWPDAWGVRMEHILRNVLMALLEQPNSTLHDILRVFLDKRYRAEIANHFKTRPYVLFYKKNSSAFRLAIAPMGLPRFKTKSELSLLIPCSIEFSRHQKKIYTSDKSWTRAKCFWSI